jgi:hypothetical protein
LSIVLSFLLWFTASDYPFVVFKMFWSFLIHKQEIHAGTIKVMYACTII